MKLMHLSDLHLGKRLNEFSLLEDQAYILHQLVHIAQDEHPDAVLIAGDLYDKPVSPAEAVSLLDDFLARLSSLHIPVMIISGNHDSPERLSFGARLISASGVYLAPVYGGTVEPNTLTDDHGPVDVFLLPFIKPSHVRRYFPDEEIATYTDAVACAIRHMNIKSDRRNVLITHQFVTGAACCESEELSVGGTDQVDASVFDAFDYVALGHIHGPQNIKSERIRYCGTPLKYSFSEAKHHKSVTMVELASKGSLSIRSIPLTPLRDMLELRGTYNELTARSYYANLDTSSYVHITLTDEEDIPDAAAKLRVIYPNLMKLDYDNRRTRTQADFTQAEEVQQRSPQSLFGEFYEKQNGQPMSAEQADYIDQLVRQLWEGHS
ncbi:MAG: exonuclease SbcCD subunit D [Clostridia bacterium]|nr:exonuclease SbcCD subunit D [Clostridia bacterium]